MRALVGLLLLANLAFLAWSQGWLDGMVGARAIGDREPERLARQLNPESVVVLAPSAATEVSALSPANCWEAGPFDDAQWANAQTAARAALPDIAWTTAEVDKPGRWIVYMGRYASPDAMARREDELRRRQLVFERISDNPTLSPGLLLGRFDERPSADRALTALEQQGVRTARVVETMAPSVSHLLRAEKLEAAQAATLAALKPEALGKGFTACARSPGG